MYLNKTKQNCTTSLHFQVLVAIISKSCLNTEECHDFFILAVNKYHSKIAVVSVVPGPDLNNTALTSIGVEYLYLSGDSVKPPH